MTITDITGIIYAHELDILYNCNNANSNLGTINYFVHLAKYKQLGGKKDILQRIINSHILDHLPTDKARKNYLINAKIYTKTAKMYFDEFNKCSYKEFEPKRQKIQEVIKQKIREEIQNENIDTSFEPMFKELFEQIEAAEAFIY